MNGKIDICISRATGSKEYMLLEIRDGQSNVEIVRCKLSFKDFIKCLTGMSLCEMPAQFGDLSKIGKKYETKTLPVPGLSYSTWENREALIKPFEVDGWSAEEKRFNQHHCTNDGYLVVFRRWV